MRIFVGLEISDEARQALKETQVNIKPYIERGNLTRPENFHLTLWFLGEVQSDLLSIVKHAVSDVAVQYSSFPVALGHLGAFQKKNREILWVGLGKGAGHLEELYRLMVKAFKHIGIHPEREGLNPHITLGRQLRLLDTVQDLRERYPTKPVEFPVEYITIFESKQVDGVLTYVPIFRTELKK